LKGGKMRIKNKSIILFILVFIGVALLGSNQVWAQIDVTDCSCSIDEINQQMCIEAFGYVIQVYVDPDTEDPVGDGAWPIDNGDGTLTFQYRACVPPGTDCKGVPTWNYFVQRQSACVAPYLVASDPPGAQLLIPGQTVPKCPSFKAGPTQHLLKINPSLNCGDGNEVVFSFTYTADVQTSFCNYSVVTTKSGCEGGFLQGPGCGDIPAQTYSSFESQGGTVDVMLDRCGQGPLEDGVTIDGATATKGKAWICTGGNPLDIGGKNPADDAKCHINKKAGLQSQGCVIDCNPRTYLYGGDSYSR
jgi:hypothetical protein